MLFLVVANQIIWPGFEFSLSFTKELFICLFILMIVSLIVAVSDNNVIGYRNTVPWRLPSELLLFKRITMGHHIIMVHTIQLSQCNVAVEHIGRFIF